MGYFREAIIGALTGMALKATGYSEPEPKSERHLHSLTEWPPRRTYSDTNTVFSGASVPGRETIFSDIHSERNRQEQLCKEGRFTHTCASPVMNNEDCYLVLGEEFGEVGRAILERNRGHSESLDKHGKDLRKELIQVAAVCVAWIERIDSEEGIRKEVESELDMMRPREQAGY